MFVSEMLEGMRRELSQLSAAYSAKCLEMTDVEEELSETRAIIDQLWYANAVRNFLLDNS